MGRPKKEQQKVPASTRLEPDVYKALDSIAKEEVRTFSQILEFAATEFAVARGKIKPRAKGK